ncbi:MAG: DUF1972 domain-containing protein [Firmicutes bacterium]|nr:DUF1972 domain-containing protein [Bacillota bacterium]
MKHVFIIGSKGIPARYGGFETFVENLTKRKVNPTIQYHVACQGEEEQEFEYNGARCFQVKLKKLGSAKAVCYDLESLQKCLDYIEEHKIEAPIIYILACRIGPFLKFYQRKLRPMNGRIYVNVDGHEWKRSKWNRWIKAYWKVSERLMVKYADLVVCDARAIQEYVKQEYHRYGPRTVYLSYGTDLGPAGIGLDAEKAAAWYSRNHLKAQEYYLVVGRFVPENNYEIIIREFMNSNTTKDLVFITNLEQNKFYRRLLASTGFTRDSRLKFVGTVYDQGLLKKIREDSFAYIHGHEVGGTNPSLLEALAATPLNLLLDVSFNREAGADGAVYFNKAPGSLAKLIAEVETYPPSRILELARRAQKRVRDNYSWEKIVGEYEELFLS